MTQKLSSAKFAAYPSPHVHEVFAGLGGGGRNIAALPHLLVAQPDVIARSLGSGAETAENDATQKALHETVAEVRTLRDTIDLFLQRADRGPRTDLEPVGCRPRPRGARRHARDSGRRTQKVAANDDTKAKEKEATAKKAKETAAKKPDKAGIETGSVAQPATGAISFGPAVVTPAARPAAATPSVPASQVGVQIATGPSVDSLRELDAAQRAPWRELPLAPAALHDEHVRAGADL